MYVPILDIFVVSVFKKHHDGDVQAYIEQNGPVGKQKLAASLSRSLFTRLTWSAWLRTLKNIDFETTFQDTGYIWVNETSVPPRTRITPDLASDPRSVDYPSSTNDSEYDDDGDEENRMDKVASDIAQQQQAMLCTKKQLTLIKTWRK